MSKKQVYGKCRICGVEKKLTQEHYIPRAAGGAMKIKLYNGEELMKTLHKDEDGNDYKPKGVYKQSGLMEYTLCKECNEYSGIYYDKDFALFYNVVQFGVLRNIDVPEDISTEDFLLDETMNMSLKKLKPYNIAKRILVSFCTVERDGLTDDNPEIRKALLDKDYTPNTDGFGLFLSLHLGNSAYYATIAALSDITRNFRVSAYAGIESDFIAFYLTTDSDTKLAGLDSCLDITHWLTDYKYNEEADLDLELTFIKSKNLLFPIS